MPDLPATFKPGARIGIEDDPMLKIDFNDEGKAVTDPGKDVIDEFDTLGKKTEERLRQDFNNLPEIEMFPAYEAEIVTYEWTELKSQMTIPYFEDFRQFPIPKVISKVKFRINQKKNCPPEILELLAYEVYKVKRRLSEDYPRSLPVLPSRGSKRLFYVSIEALGKLLRSKGKSRKTTENNMRKALKESNQTMKNMSIMIDKEGRPIHVDEDDDLYADEAESIDESLKILEKNRVSKRLARRGQNPDLMASEDRSRPGTKSGKARLKMRDRSNTKSRGRDTSKSKSRRGDSKKQLTNAQAAELYTQRRQDVEISDDPNQMYDLNQTRRMRSTLNDDQNTGYSERKAKGPFKSKKKAENKFATPFMTGAEYETEDLRAPSTKTGTDIGKTLKKRLPRAIDMTNTADQDSPATRLPNIKVSRQLKQSVKPDFDQGRFVEDGQDQGPPRMYPDEYLNDQVPKSRSRIPADQALKTLKLPPKLMTVVPPVKKKNLQSPYDLEYGNNYLRSAFNIDVKMSLEEQRKNRPTKYTIRNFKNTRLNKNKIKKNLGQIEKYEHSPPFRDPDRSSVSPPPDNDQFSSGLSQRGEETTFHNRSARGFGLPRGQNSSQQRGTAEGSASLKEQAPFNVLAEQPKQFRDPLKFAKPFDIKKPPPLRTGDGPSVAVNHLSKGYKISQKRTRNERGAVNPAVNRSGENAYNYRSDEEDVVPRMNRTAGGFGRVKLGQATIS